MDGHITRSDQGREKGNEGSRPPSNLTSASPPLPQVRLINNGALPARFVVEHQMAGLFGGWLGVSPSSGTVLPGEPLPLTISFVTEDIWQGSYKGSVTISSGQQRVSCLIGRGEREKRNRREEEKCGEEEGKKVKERG